VIASAIGAAATAIGVLLAYDSYYWGSSRRGYPVSFFVVSLVFVAYLLAGLSSTNRRRGA
jgi:zinc/manganese transport system permease protein